MDKKLAIFGSAMILLLVGGLFCYQKQQDNSEVIARTESAEQEKRPETISGHEDEEDLVKYMLYQLQQEDLDLALRACAIQGVAENFNLETYIEYTESYDPLAVLPPTNWESPAYSAISEMRLEGFYTGWLQKCMEQLGKAHTVTLYGIQEDVPENPDGKYYERLNTICELRCARSVKEMLIYAEIDGQPKELRWTRTRHGKSWRVLCFTSLDGYGAEQPEICDSREDFRQMEVQEYATEDVLPVDYSILNANGEQTPEKTIQNFSRYLMRQDVWSAASYVKVYDGTQPHTTVELMNKQSSLAEKLQAFYYRLFFNNQEKYDWYFRDLPARAGNIAEDLRSDQIIVMNLGWMAPLSDPSEDTMTYQVAYSYGLVDYPYIVTLCNENGWRITDIEAQ